MRSAPQPLHFEPLHDHISDHKQNRNTRKQRIQNLTRALPTERKAAEMAANRKNVKTALRDQGETKKKQPGGLFFRSFSAQSREWAEPSARGDRTRPCTAVGSTGSNPVTPTKTKSRHWRTCDKAGTPNSSLLRFAYRVGKSEHKSSVFLVQVTVCRQCLSTML